MRFRWKVLILLLLLSIGPIALMRTIGLQSVRQFRDTLMDRVRSNRLASEQERLQLIADTHAHALWRARSQVEAALMALAAHAEQVLEQTPNGRPQHYFTEDFDSDTNLPDDAIVSPVHHRENKDGEIKFLAVSYNEPVFQVPPVVERADVADDVARLAGLRETFRRLSRLVSDMAIWQNIGLANGLFCEYPGHGSIPAAFDTRHQHWYEKAMESRRPDWTTPFVDPATRQVVVAAVMPVLGPSDDIAGAVSIVVPIRNLIENKLFARNIPAATRVFMCQLPSASKENETRALIVAQDEQTEAKHRSWRAELAAQWLVSADTDQFAALLKDAAAGMSNTRKMPFRNTESLWIYSQANQGTFFVLVTPYEEILAPVQEAETAVQQRIDAMVAVTRYGLIIVLVATIGLSLLMSQRVTRPLWNLVKGARRLAAGDFDAKVEIRSRDEFGKVGEVFNQVGPHLKEMQEIRQSLAVAMEVQQRLLPRHAPQIPGFDIAGSSVYCVERGGDYYDFIRIPDGNGERLHVAVGDVSGHGIPAALLMTSTRAFLRQRAAIPGDIEHVVADINEQLAKDVDDSGQFVTLFYAEIDIGRHRLRWVRAGHEPAIRYDAATEAFDDLGGRGMPLGVFKEADFRVEQCPLSAGQIVFIGTDGIWETRNGSGEMFGKDRLKQLVRRHATRAAEELVSVVMEAVADFRGSRKQEDDMTLVVIKVLAA